MTNRYLLGAGVALALALAGVQAHAQSNMLSPDPPGSFYLGPEGGWTPLNSRTTTGDVTVLAAPGTLFNGTHTARAGNLGYDATSKTNSGFNAGVRAGYEWGPWRFEEEYSDRNNALSSFSGAIGGKGLAGTGFSGSTHSNAFMTNAIRDFPLGGPITPHLGVGVGAVNVLQSISGP
jgi:opacity protein-like surface antigen